MSKKRGKPHHSFFDLTQGCDAGCKRKTYRTFLTPITMDEGGKRAGVTLPGLMQGFGGWERRAAFSATADRGQVSVVGGFWYSRLPYAALLGWAVWGYLPDAITSTGMAVLVAAGLYLTHCVTNVPRRAHLNVTSARAEVPPTRREHRYRRAWAGVAAGRPAAAPAQSGAGDRSRPIQSHHSMRCIDVMQ